MSDSVEILILDPGDWLRREIANLCSKPSFQRLLRTADYGFGGGIRGAKSSAAGTEQS
jgi:hypothetical protein